MILPALSFISGILCVQWLSAIPFDVAFLLFIIPIVYVKFKQQWMRLVLSFAFGFIWALFRADLILSNQLPVAVENQDLLVTGTIFSTPKLFDRGQRFQFVVDKVLHHQQLIKMKGRIKLSWYYQPVRLYPGEKWQFKVKLKRPHGFSNPGGFDYEKYLFQQQIVATGYIKQSDDNKQLASYEPWYALKTMRAHLFYQLDEWLGDFEFRGLMAALALGKRDWITVAQENILIHSGTSHLIAISGLHIGLIAGFFYFISRKIWALSQNLTNILPAPVAASLVGLLAAFFYACLAGMSISTQRALIMVGLVMVLNLSKRQIPPSQFLLMTLATVLLYDPFAVTSIGFWLSFCAVAVIYFVLWSQGKKRPWQSAVIIQGAITIMLIPLVLFFFNTVSLVSPIANIVAVPFVGFVILPLILISIILAMMNTSAGMFGFSVCEYLFSWLWQWLTWLVNWQGSDIVFNQPTIWAVLFAIIGAFIFLMPKGLPGKYLACLLFMPLFLGRIEKPEVARFYVTVLDVGQGLSVVVKTRNHVLVYDTGPKFSARFNAGTAVVHPYLKSIGVKRIDKLIVSHTDNDHMGGLTGLRSEYPIVQLMSGMASSINGAIACNEQQKWSWDEVEFEMIYPPINHELTGNNASCVIKISNSFHQIMLVGDIEQAVEKQMIEKYSQTTLKSDILVAPHHGSKTSSSLPFLSMVLPQYTVFSSGYMNRFGHPYHAVVNRYQELGVKILNTANTGAVIFKVDNQQYLNPPIRWRHEYRRFFHWENK